jgi:tRNA G18 (ribose-2'-O)-methylase SpoU
MVRIHKIQDFDLPELRPYRTMRSQEAQAEQNIFVAEGEKVVRRLLDSSLAVVSLVLPDKWLNSYVELLNSRNQPVDIYVAEKKVLEELTGFSMYQGVLAIARIPAPVTLDQVLAQSAAPLLLAAVDSVSSAENMGGLVRSCAAFGVHGLITSQASCSPYLRRAVRSSMGAIFKLPAVQVADLAEGIATLKQHHIRVIAAHPHTEGRLDDCCLEKSCCIVFGSEGEGISPAVLQQCDKVAGIPMQNEVDSLNVATAGAVFLYEAWRQRQATLPGGNTSVSSAGSRSSRSNTSSISLAKST